MKASVSLMKSSVFDRRFMGEKMCPVRTVYVPCFSSQLGSSQRDEADLSTEQPEGPRHDQRGKAQNRSVLRVKLPRLNKKGRKEDKTRRRWTSEPASNKTETTVSRAGGEGGGAECVGTDSDSVVGDAFSFSEGPTSKAINEKEKAKLAVLRTISKVLEENQLIRQRLAALSQAS